jgi:succinate dehydrogenase hydrophobic anchor subunit
MKGLSWLFQLLTGVALVFFVVYHFVVTHIVGSLAYEDVLERLVSLKAFYVIFLLIVVFHAFNGLKVISEEYGLRWSKVFYIAMVVAIAYGLYNLF